MPPFSTVPTAESLNVFSSVTPATFPVLIIPGLLLLESVPPVRESRYPVPIPNTMSSPYTPNTTRRAIGAFASGGVTAPSSTTISPSVSIGSPCCICFSICITPPIYYHCLRNFFQVRDDKVFDISIQNPVCVTRFVLCPYVFYHMIWMDDV